jgi:chorismate-pyruvate lyase
MTATRAAVTAFLDHFVAQHERPAGEEELDIAALSPRHRCLLVTDGTVTNQLHAWTLEPTRTVCLERRTREPTALERRWLAAEPGLTGIARRVEIRGAWSGSAFLAAWSFLLPARLPEGFVDSLQQEEGSIGTALLRGSIEHRRELLWCVRGRAAVASRTYRVYVRGVPALLIGEDFLC